MWIYREKEYENNEYDDRVAKRTIADFRHAENNPWRKRIDNLTNPK